VKVKERRDSIKTVVNILDLNTFVLCFCAMAVVIGLVRNWVYHPLCLLEWFVAGERVSG